MSNKPCKARAVLSQTCRALTGRWLLTAALCTALTLWLGLGNDSYWLLLGMGYEPELPALMLPALCAESAVLSLPVLSALPAAAAAYTELSTGAARAMIFRTGRRGWRWGKLCGCMASAAISQLAGALIFTPVLALVVYLNGGTLGGAEFLAALLTPVAARCLGGMAFALFGGAMALVSNTAAAAYAAPLAACFTLKLLGSRFFVGVRYVDPADWLTGDPGGILAAAAALVITALLYDALLGREMARYA